MTTADPALLAAMVARHPDPVVATDAAGKLCAASEAFFDALGLTGDILGRAPYEALDEPLLAAALDPARAGPHEINIRTGSHDYQIRSVSLGPDGGRFAVLRNVTDAREDERSRIVLVGNVSHELRTPTTSIVGYAETILEEAERLDPEIVQMVEVIHRNGLRLSAIFEDLLSLARLEARSDPLPPEPVSVSSVVAEVMDKWRPSADEKNISFQTAIPRGIRVHGNYRGLVHLIGNLVENAVKYSHPDGLVTLRSWSRGGRVCIEIIDLGIGIGPEHHKRIFERFYRVDKSRSRAAGGTGLGLALVARLAAVMRAEVEVRSKAGHGSVFRVWLPPAPGESTDNEA
jgi:two-component system phosphate regulon sensor histidine kinase PhoR